jgi:hypothetical protein
MVGVVVVSAVRVAQCNLALGSGPQSQPMML